MFVCEVEGLVKLAQRVSVPTDVGDKAVKILPVSVAALWEASFGLGVVVVVNGKLLGVQKKREQAGWSSDAARARCHVLIKAGVQSERRQSPERLWTSYLTLFLHSLPHVPISPQLHLA